MIKLCQKDKEQLLQMASSNNVYIEGPLLKLLDSDGDEGFKNYLDEAIRTDQDNRRKRLEIAKQLQEQNRQLTSKAEENDRLMLELKDSIEQAESAKKEAINDLDLLQRRTQTELIGNIVNVALYTITGVGLITTALYAAALFTGSTDTTLLGNTWSNLFGILLTNSFSIIGTIMGVKYASNGEKSEKK
tara:strand:+ start:378 stop:944 length:567 start_codon:yes stop_codon:yes gene_type:complete